MTAREQRARRRRRRVREDILEVTRTLVLKEGIASLTLTAIADELELTKAALYYYFESKDALLFELTFGAMLAEVEAVESAIADAETSAEAIEGLIRAVATHYAGKLDEFRLTYLAGQVGAAVTVRPEFLERIRPLNDRMYGRAEALMRAEQDAGLVAADVDPRRAVFLAHCATVGVLTMQGMVDAGGDAPLAHTDADLIDDLVVTHTRGLRR